MKNLKKWILIVGLAGQTFLPVSCSGTFTRQVKQAFVDGFAAFIQTSTQNLLTQYVPLP